MTSKLLKLYFKVRNFLVRLYLHLWLEYTDTGKARQQAHYARQVKRKMVFAKYAAEYDNALSVESIHKAKELAKKNRTRKRTSRASTAPVIINDASALTPQEKPPGDFD